VHVAADIEHFIAVLSEPAFSAPVLPTEPLWITFGK
jgi:hypothetical protein